MDKKSTPSKCTLPSRDSKPADEASPSRVTLAMIRQFARVYHYDSRVDSRLGGMIVN